MKANITASFIIGFALSMMLLHQHSYISTILLGIGLAIITLKLMTKPYPEEEKEWKNQC